MTHPEPTSKATSEANGSTADEKPECSGDAADREHEEPPGSIAPADGPAQNDDQEYPPVVMAVVIMISCVLPLFLLSLDRTIIGVAIPEVTNEFHSITDIGWYGSAYMLTNCSVQLLYGRIYKFFSVKYVFLISIAFFLIGSAVCGAAPSSNALIVGRAIAGIGAAGMSAGMMQILVHAVPLEKRPVFTGMFGAVSGIASVAGPLLGGAFTERLTWRWCFYINLPFGAVSSLAVIFLIKNYKPAEGDRSLREKINRLDLIGTAIFVPCMTGLLLALEWGGSTYPWNNWRIILLFVVFGVCLLVWLLVQAWKKDNATVPGRIFFQRSILAAFFYTTFITAVLMIVVYYIPLWFQAVKGQSPVDAGVSALPSILSLVVASVIGGIFTSKIGYYWPTMNVAPIVASVGAGLLTTLTPDTGHPRWIAFQFLTGFGVGMGQQQATLATQTVLPAPDIPIGISLAFFGQQLGGSVFLAIAETIFNQQLTANLQDSRISSSAVERIINTGATDLQRAVSPSSLPRVLSAYSDAITTTLYLGVGLACVALVPAMLIERRSIKRKGNGKPQAAPAADGAGEKAGIAASDDAV